MQHKESEQNLHVSCETVKCSDGSETGCLFWSLNTRQTNSECVRDIGGALPASP